MSMRESFEVTDSVATEIRPYVQAMMGASGLNEFNAAASVLFAISTHIDLPQYPILVYLGARGTGKTEAMKRLVPMCKNSKWIEGTTYATQRNALRDVRTAFLDEADRVDNNDELRDLYTKRYLSNTGAVEINAPPNNGRGWETQRINIFGATVMAKRTPIADVALRSRAIILETEFRDFVPDNIRVGSIAPIASGLSQRVRRNVSSSEIDRIAQTWSGLYTIANELNMGQWNNECLEIQLREVEALQGGQGYEPRDAILQAIDILCRNEVGQREDKSIRISEVARTVRDEFALNLKPAQVKDAAEGRGFETSTLRGYPVIKVKVDHLTALLPERGEKKGDGR